ncbi:LysR substrate-binding domain-containing protein [Desulfobaculum sp. SPO524]|uniref:LysR substrate-binding domain-containing protein n=1 Tax=Desulfobaculum sp. SPO524 TaxID=3378071 RepID=UPI0038527614
MEHRHLRYFLAVAEELHFGRAAKRLNMSQPPLSQQIRQLEEELGVELFTRTSRQVELTRAGEVFQAEVVEILSSVERAVQRVRSVGAGKEGELRLGAVVRMYLTPIPLALRKYHDEFPRVSLHLKDCSTAKQLRLMREKRLDIGCVSYVPEGDTLFESTPLNKGCVRQSVVLPEGHPLAARDEVSLQDLDGEPMVMFPRCQHPQWHDAIHDAMHSAGVEMNVVQVVERVQTGLALVASGLGYTIHYRPLPFGDTPGIVVRPLREHLPSPSLSLVWRCDEKDPLVLRFVDIVRECIAERPMC